MRVIFRADASVAQGSGHVMRCLTLAEELTAGGHEVMFASAVSSIGWLTHNLESSRYAVVPVEADTLDANALLALNPDWVVVDSYRIPAPQISALAERVPILAIVDGETRGIEAALYLEQNLGSERQDWGGLESRMLTGSRYALIRDAILSERLAEPARLRSIPVVTAFMGGTDPAGVIVRVAAQLATVGEQFRLVVVAPEKYHAELGAIVPGSEIVEPTTSLPALLGASDVVVSAAGTSAWDVCTLAIPALFVGVVDNQSMSLTGLIDGEFALGVDLTTGGDIDDIALGVRRLLNDGELRHRLSTRCASEFDGIGKHRVAAALIATTPEHR